MIAIGSRVVTMTNGQVDLELLRGWYAIGTATVEAG